jgi:hypothetical protein
MRVVKELITLSQYFNVDFIGIGKDSNVSFGSQYCNDFTLIRGSRRSIVALALLCFTILRKRLTKSYQSAHVVQEQLYIIIMPILLGLHVVVDIFDSLFLKFNLPGERARNIKRLFYHTPNKIIVTDEMRQGLLPDIARPKSIVLPNFPTFVNYPPKLRPDPERLTIAYCGSMASYRGTDFLLSLLALDSRVHCICAGWLADKRSHNLIEHPRVNYLGTIPQREVNDYIWRHCDYILAIYPTWNLNNIYASPNKLYDAIQTRTPIIINSEAKISAFVRENKFGISVDKFSHTDICRFIDELMIKRGSFLFPEDVVEACCWEKVQDRLISSHQTR